jgi:2-polyprenyl-3-methyl-5-hydroxy-6-metoxy-1,4-benzoquinol methylase
MYDFHTDKGRYFQMTYQVAADEVLPYLEQLGKSSTTHKRVLEIGCGEAGVLCAFVDRGYIGCGVELMENRAITAKKNLEKYIADGTADIISKNIYDIDPSQEWNELFDVIVLKDVIEHIPDQERFIPQLRKFLKPDGLVFFGYPPWWMPYGGHQQVCRSKILHSLPWFHLLPMTIYKAILKVFGESELTIHNLVEVKETGITIDRLLSILRANKYEILGQKYWMINPIYQHKFKMKKRMVPSFLTHIPYLRNMYTTAHYVVFR